MKTWWQQILKVVSWALFLYAGFWVLMYIIDPWIVDAPSMSASGTGEFTHFIAASVKIVVILVAATVTRYFSKD